MTIRLLEVSVESVEASRWKWRVMHGTDEVACGYETSRETAQNAGDSVLFELLSEPETQPRQLIPLRGVALSARSDWLSQLAGWKNAPHR